MVDTTYNLVTKSNGTYFARFNLADLNSINRGTTTSFTFELPPNPVDDITYTSDTTIPAEEVEQYDDVTINNGVTLTVNGKLRADTITVDGTLVTNGDVSVSENGLAAWLSYQEWAGKYSTLEMLDGTEKYTIQIPDDENIDSLVIGIEPSSDLKDKEVEGIWGLIESIEDVRNPSLNTYRFALNIRVLGQYNDYTNITDLENNLEANP